MCKCVCVKLRTCICTMHGLLCIRTHTNKYTHTHTFTHTHTHILCNKITRCLKNIRLFNSKISKSINDR